jgi:molecular chaperone DnaK (HSP70)
MLFFSCVAVWKNGRPEICPNEQGNRVTPSYVAWTSDGQRLVGDAAKNQAATNPTNTVFDIKRLIGRKYSDPSVQRDAKLLPFKSKIYFVSNQHLVTNNVVFQLPMETLTSLWFAWRAAETPRSSLLRKSVPWYSLHYIA